MLGVLEIEKKRIPLAMAAVKQSIAGAQMEDLFFPQLLPSDFSGAGFKISAALAPVRFRPLRYLRSSLKKVLLP